MAKTAQLYRMVMPDHTCPYGLKSKDLLERNDFTVEDHPLTSREETDAFMEKHGLTDGATETTVCAAGRREITEGTEIGALLLEVER